MKSRNIYFALLAGGLLVVAGFFVYPGSKSEAQKAPSSDKREVSPLTSLRENDMASRFYDKMSQNVTGLQLVKFVAPSSVNHQKVTTMIFEKASDEVSVSINEYDSAEGPAARFGNPTNARVEPFNTYGDQGKKIYHPYGKGEFTGLAFRKGNFYVTISCKDEAVAEKLAASAVETIG